LGNLEEVSSTGDFKRLMKEALGGAASLSEEALWGGPWRQLLHWRPWKIC